MVGALPVLDDSLSQALGPRSVVLALAGPSAGIHLWPDVLGPFPGRAVAEIDSVYSVYAVAVSPLARFIAWGHRSGENGFGGGEVCYLSATEPGIVKTVGRHRGGCFSVSFLTEDTLVSGGADGHLRIWDLRLGQQVREVSINRRCAFSVCVLSPRLLAVLGADRNEGELSLWNVGSLSLCYKGSRVLFPRGYGLIELVFDEEEICLYHPCEDGSIASYVIDGNAVHEKCVPRHSSFFYAVGSIQGAGLVSAGYEDCMVRVGPPGSVVYEMQVPGNPLVCVPVPPDLFLLFDQDRRGQVWRWVNQRLELVLTLPGWGVRGVAAMPEKALRRWEQEAVASRRKNLLSQVDKAQNAGNWEELYNLSVPLAELGLMEDSWMARAQVADARQQSLELLQALLALERLLPSGSRWHKEVHYRLGDLLEVLNEPHEALVRYRVLLSGPDVHRDLVERIHRLEGIPVAATVGCMIRNDLAAADALVRFVQVSSLLNRPVCGLFPLLDSTFPINYRHRLSFEEFSGAFSLSCDRVGLCVRLDGPFEGIECLVTTRKRARWWLVAPSAGTSSKVPLGMAVVIVLQRREGITKLAPVAVLDPSRCGIDEVEPTRFNCRFEEMWRLLHESEDVGLWFDSVCLSIDSALEDLLRGQDPGLPSSPVKEFEVLP